MANIKNIFFDFGRTVVQHPADEAGIGVVKSFADVSDADARTVRDAVFSSKLLSLLDTNDISFEEYKAKIKEKLPENLHAIGLNVAEYHISALPYMEGMEELLSEIKAQGYKLYITSNMDAHHGAQMKDTPAAKYFDGMIFSGEIGVGKPAPEFFRAACEKFNTSPAQTLFIDDLEENVLGAKEYGIEGLVFDGNPEKVREFLKSFD